MGSTSPTWLFGHPAAKIWRFCLPGEGFFTGEVFFLPEKVFFTDQTVRPNSLSEITRDRTLGVQYDPFINTFCSVHKNSYRG